MAANRLVSFIETRSSALDATKSSTFSNEYETQFQLHAEKNLKTGILNCLDDLKPNKTYKSVAISDRYREEGNRLFRANRKHNALAASRNYTNAILAAPEDSTSLALAHANRAAALVEFGYYSQAYEDCQCAQDFGYPQGQLEKIVMRQACCASKLDSNDKLTECLVKLRKMSLSEPFVRQRSKFEEDLTKLEARKTENKTVAQNTADLKVQSILVHTLKGRYMTAAKDIPEGGTILVEKAFSFVPVNEAKICSNCAVEQLIPFPCNTCSKVVYCSLNCKNLHKEIHKYECYAYSCGIFEALGITHLALNTLLHGLPSIISNLRHWKTGKEIWKTIENITKSGSRGYAEILSLVTHLEKLSVDFVRSFGLSAAVVTYYLLERTSFFEHFQQCACDAAEWVPVVSGLILRHAAQMVANAQSNVAIVYLEKSYDFLPLSDIWIKPHHLKKRLLNKFRGTDMNYSGIFPYLSLCNHSCEPSLRLNFNGNRVIALARNRLTQGDEIFNSYSLDSRSALERDRQSQLEMYHFKCDCKSCSQQEKDLDYLKFHNYKCINPKCKAMFTPANDTDIHWWLKDEASHSLKCPHCGTRMELDWYTEFITLVQKPELDIQKLTKIFKYSEKFLVNYSELRHFMALNVVDAFFQVWKDNVSVSETEFKDIGSLIKYCLDYVEHRNDVESILYATTSTFALDLMAEGNYFDYDFIKMQQSFNALPTEVRIVFDNYIDDFIKCNFKV